MSSTTFVRLYKAANMYLGHGTKDMKQQKQILKQYKLNKYDSQHVLDIMTKLDLSNSRQLRFGLHIYVGYAAISLMLVYICVSLDQIQIHP